MGKKARSQIKIQQSNSQYPLGKSSLRIIGVCGIIIFLITFIIYTPALKNDLVNWDDPEYVYENSHISSLTLHSCHWMLTTFHAGNWHPLTWLSHAVDYAFFSLKPLGHHLTSIVLHGLNTLLVFLLAIQLMLKAKAVNAAPLPCTRSLSLPIQALIVGVVTALLFGVHPLHVESVAWVAERKDVLCAFFFLLTLCSYLFYTSSVDTKNQRFWFTACVVLFTAALMAKPMAVTLPLVLLLLDHYPLKRVSFSARSYLNRRVLLEKAPFFCLSMVSTVLTVLAQHGEGALPSMERLPLRFRLINAFHSPLFYAGKMLWPLDLVPIYPFPAHSDFLDLKYVFAPILVVGVTGVCLLLLKRGSYLLFTAWSYYLIALSPVVGVVQVGRQAAADRYTYLPSISIFLLVGMGVSWLAGRSSSVINKVMCGVLLAMLILLAQVTIQQIKIWQDPETLWSCVVKRLPGRVLIAHNNLGQVYSNKGMYDNAVVQFEKALAIDPNYAKAYNNLGLVYYAKGMFDEANAQFKNALTINPNLAEAYNNLGLVYYTKGMFDEAIVQFEKALAIDPNYANTHNNLGLVYYTKGMFDEAIAQFAKTLAINPHLAEPNNNMGLAYDAKGMFDEAIALFEKALAINPNYASTHNNIGLAYYKKGNYIVAKGHFDKALKLGYKVDPKLLESVKRDRSVH